MAPDRTGRTGQLSLRESYRRCGYTIWSMHLPGVYVRRV